MSGELCLLKDIFIVCGEEVISSYNKVSLQQ